jgi:hypothetical protein
VSVLLVLVSGPGELGVASTDAGVGAVTATYVKKANNVIEAGDLDSVPNLVLDPKS